MKFFIDTADIPEIEQLIPYIKDELKKATRLNQKMIQLNFFLIW